MKARLAYCTWFLLVGVAGGLASAEPPAGNPRMLSATAGEGRSDLTWDKGGADFVDIHGKAEDGVSRLLLVRTPRESATVEGQFGEFEVRNPLMWRFRSVARNVYQSRITSMALDAQGEPSICYLDVLSESLRLRLATRRGPRWEAEVIMEAAPIRIALGYSPEGMPFVVFTLGDGTLHCADRTAEGEWKVSQIARSRHFAMARSPTGKTGLVYLDGEYSVPNPAALIYAVKSPTGWERETVDVGTEAKPAHSLCLAYSPSGQPGIAYEFHDKPDNPGDFKTNLRLMELTDTGWVGRTVVSEISSPCLAYDPHGNPGFTFHSIRKGLLFATPEGGGWKTTIVDPGPCDAESFLAFGPNGNIGILYRDDPGSEKIRSRYASHDGNGWQSQTLWTEGGEYGQSLVFDRSGNPVISFLAEKGERLRYGTLVPHDEGVTADDNPVKPVAPPKERVMEGEKLPVTRENLEGKWLRPDPREAGSSTMLELTREGGFIYGAEGGIGGMLASSGLAYRGTFSLKDGKITGRWEKKDNPLAFEDVEEMEIEVVALTNTHLELRFHSGRPPQVFQRAK